MGATQVDIAKALRMDVSTINKILNKVPGPKFKPETVARVFKTARRLGYNFGRGSKGKLRELLFELFPTDSEVEVLAVARGISPSKVREIWGFLKATSRTAPALLVLLVLRSILGQ